MAKKPSADDEPRSGVIPTTLVPASSDAVLLGRVQAGETWRFAAEGRWRDALVPCGPNGYRNFAFDILDIHPREPEHDWFCLIGQVEGGETFAIGAGCEHQFQTSGALVAFANDRRDGRGGNAGAVEVRGARLAAATRPIDPETDPRRFKGPIGWWRLIQLAYQQSQGCGLVAALVFLVAFALAGITQGRDLVRTVAEDGFSVSGDAIWKQIAFCLGLLLFATQAWIWPRMIINSNSGLDRDKWGLARPYLEWMPRLLAAVPFLAAGVGLMLTDDPDAWFLRLLLVLSAAVFFPLIIWRTKLGAAITDRAPKAPRAPKLGRGWVIFSAFLGAAGMLAFIVSPVWVARFLGAPTVVFLGVGLIIPYLIIATQFGRIFQIPVVPALLLLAFVVSLFPSLDNHAVGRRALSSPVGKPAERTVAPRLDLDQAYRLWRAQAPRDAEGRPIMVLVAAEGGASRAGFWTGEVLSALHERTGGRFRNALFAISSVSGGSVGAVGYAATLQENPAIAPQAVAPAIEQLTGADALSPAIGGLLFPDLFHRFVPLPVLPDRAEGLERSWEAAWAHGRKGRPLRLDQSFLDLRPVAGEPWRPILMINGASEQTGRRILTSTLAPHPRLDAHDFHQLTGRDIPISSAIHNGARFPWVSPAGTLTREGRPKAEAQGHIIDGGYFDSVGIEALRELADAIAQGPARAEPLHIIFVVAAYSGQPQKLADPAARATTSSPSAPLNLAASEIKPVWWLNELLAPARGFFASRDGHGYHMARELRTLVAQRSLQTPLDAAGGGSSALYAPIMLCEDKSFRNPMNWALSKRSQDHMRCAAGRSPVEDAACRIDCPLTRSQIAEVAAIINGGTTPP